MLNGIQDEVLKEIKKAKGNQNFDLVDETFFLNIPTTRYYGSKRRVLPWLYENFKDLDFNTSLDAFGGTATVSLLLKRMGKHVTFNDGLTFNSLTARALLSSELPFTTEYFGEIINSIEPHAGVIARNFEDKFYTQAENKWLDGSVRVIEKLPEDFKAFFYYCVFQACLQKRPYNLFHRANLNLRQKEVKRSFGNLSTWNTPFEKLIFQSHEELTRCIWDSGVTPKVLKPSDALNIKPDYDFVYIDPPYIGSKTRNENYLKRYHFLEGICRYNEWESIVNKKNKTYDILEKEGYEHIQKWNTKSYFKDYLFQLIDTHKNSIVALSYVDNAFPVAGEIYELFKDRFKSVKFSSYKLSHALSAVPKKELLFIGIP